uniref:Cell cycle control protein 50C n=1 Tax=Podarcis muralis TaxID=64176 RepID=A0A670IJS3_PODMU
MQNTVSPNRPSRCPDNTAYKQQRLPAWKPQLTPELVLPSFFIISLFCLVMGIVLLLAATRVKEIKVCFHCVLESMHYNTGRLYLCISLQCVYFVLFNFHNICI